MKIKILIGVLSVVLLCLLAMIPIVNHMTTPQESSSPIAETTPLASQSITQTSSVPETQAPTQPTTQPVTTIPTQPPTAPPTTPATMPATKPDPKDPVDVFIQEKMNTWICPVKDAFGDVVGSRTFASSRGGGKRAHAGLDFVAPHGTKVYAITSGTVQRVALFYQNTWAVEIANDDGSILRYCEIATDLKAGDYVKQGDIVGTILRADSGTEMVHMEVYLGDGEGALTQTGNKTYTYVDSKNYLRRSDLLDPTFLKDLPKG